jgi:hypothetical protein
MTCLACGNKGWVVEYAPLPHLGYEFELEETPIESVLKTTANWCSNENCPVYLDITEARKRRIRIEIDNYNSREE